MIVPAGAKKKTAAPAPAPSMEMPADAGEFYIELPIDRCVPNDWNMNVMTSAQKEKLRNGMKDLLKRRKKLIPIAVRNHPTRAGIKQIIDGENRWSELRDWASDEFGITTLSAVDYGDLDDAKAMELTASLNYNRGEPDPERYVLYLKRYLETSHYDLEQAARFLPDAVDEMRHALEAYEIKIDHLEAAGEAGDDDDTQKRGIGEQSFVELKFSMAREQAEIVEKALARVGALLKGKNIRGRALELIAADSLNTPLDSYGTAAGPPAEEEPSDTTVERTRSRLREVAE